MNKPEVMELELSSIVLPVKKVREAAEWYVTQLDMDVVQESSNSITLAGPNGFALELRRGRPLDHPERVHLLVQAENIEAIFQRMNDARVQFLTDPQVTEHGRRIATV